MTISTLTATVRERLIEMRLTPSKKLYSIEVSAREGLFTRQGTRPENFSYPLPTPAAARGIVESVYWKPEVVVQVERIAILNEPRWRSQMINGVNGTYPLSDEFHGRVKLGLLPRAINVQSRRGSQYAAGCELDVHIGENVGRNQVAHTLLENPRFAITFRLLGRDGSNLRAHCAMLERRLARGESFRWACMGKKAHVAQVVPVASLRSLAPVDYTEFLPGMYYDQFDYFAGHASAAARLQAGDRPSATYFDAHIDAGVMQVPYFIDEAVRRVVPT